MTMTSQSLNTVFSLLALGAAGVALTLVSMAPPPPPTIDMDAIDALRVEQTWLRKELARLQEEMLKPPMVAEPAATPERQELPFRTAQLTEDLKAIASRLEKLEQKAQAAATRNASLPALAHLMQSQPRLTPEQRQQKLQELRTKAMDGTQMDTLRLVALSQLRSLGKGARCGEVARSMINLAQGTEDPKIRAGIWRHMHRAKDRQLIDPMIQALAHDTEGRVREEAAESLGFFLDVPRAKAALEHAMRNDAAKGVRREAERSMDGKNR